MKTQFNSALKDAMLKTHDKSQPKDVIREYFRRPITPSRSPHQMGRAFDLPKGVRVIRVNGHQIPILDSVRRVA